MVDTFTPPMAPSYQGTSIDEEPRVLVNKFGNGYEQRTADGLNNNPISGTLSWDALSQTQLDEIVDFMRTKNAVDPFYYTFPGDVDPVLLKATKWSKSFKQAGTYGLSVSIMQVFDIV